MQVKAEIMFDVYGAEDGQCKIDGEVNEHLVCDQIRTYLKKVFDEFPEESGVDILTEEIGAFDTSISVVSIK